MPSNLRFIRIPTLAVLACLALTTLIVAGSAREASAANCKNPSSYPYHGYYTGGTFRVTKVSCSYGRKLIVAFQKCRTRSGKHLAGHCTQKISGFRCSEKRTSIPTEIDARVTCRRGGTQRIVHTYQQNLDE